MAKLLRRQGDLRRDDSRDYDCFYASVFEAENPALKSLPLAVQQKQIVVTCNYEARRRGLRKLQLIKEARKICPEVIIVPGEDLTRFRDASKELYLFLKSFVWGKRVEKLGFDEVFLDVTPMIDYNIELLNPNDLANSFFQLDKTDPTKGFAYDACTVSGPTYPPTPSGSPDDTAPHGTPTSDTPLPEPTPTSALHQRLILGSHLANYIRTQLESQKNYTSTAGISTSKLLAKLAGNVHKPRNQTTLLPPYEATGQTNGTEESNITTFLSPHDIAAVPGIGFKIAHRLRSHILRREPSAGIYEELPTADKVTVNDVRTYPGMGPVMLDEILAGGAWPRDIGARIWGLINGIDPTPVAEARAVPTQISIEDSYGRLDRMEAVRVELVALARSLVRRVYVDLTEVEEEEEGEGEDDDDAVLGNEGSIEHSTTDSSNRQQISTAMPKPQKPKKIHWLARPRTLRLSTRVRPHPHHHYLPDSTNRDFISSTGTGRVSKSTPMPSFLFSLTTHPTTNDPAAVAAVDALAHRLVDEALLPLFRKLHPPGGGRWDLCIVNVAATNMVDGPGGAAAAGRDIGKMFRRQERVLRGWRVSGEGEGEGEVRMVDVDADAVNKRHHYAAVDDDDDDDDDNDDNAEWDSDGDEDMLTMPSIGDGEEEGEGVSECMICRLLIPHFAVRAHERFHAVPD
ncbi:hypothetical protein FQN50_009300 [Emmonsiellopsis sp. PD_5]|nr:hypothetical protein FQN50_009300 [Emmonsiellopsis sp. PD_5]